jgi:two-component system, OmpR family, phosphate regulon response regulator PhoB
MKRFFLKGVDYLMGPSSSTKKILIVDDEEDMRIFISTVVETSGYAAMTAANGEDALKIARSCIPDLVILDIMMPGIEDGIQTFFQFKSDADLKHIPVIMLSAISKKTFFHYIRTFPSNDDALHEPDGYMEKPPDAAELILLIESAFKSRRENHG